MEEAFELKFKNKQVFFSQAGEGRTCQAEGTMQKDTVIVQHCWSMKNVWERVEGDAVGLVG